MRAQIKITQNNNVKNVNNSDAMVERQCNLKFQQIHKVPRGIYILDTK